MKNLIVLVLVLACFQFIACEKQVYEKPNVILILTDDQGYGDLSCHGNPILKTPTLDRLHDESIRFTDFHVSAICTPTRSQILTGLDACRNGAFAWAYSRETIRPEVETMPEIFRKNGYATGHFGKWHLGDNFPYRPIDRGFDESIKHGGASIFQTPDYWDNDYVDDHYEHNGKMKQYKGYCTDVWFEEAKKFMTNSNREGKPFFIYLPTNAPHGPLIVPQHYSKPYLKDLEKGYTAEKEFKKSKEIHEEISWFYGMISNIDENMEKLDIYLKDNQLYENTILIFMTDNGGTAGSRVYNAGMRGNKGSLYDGGHRVPFFIRWPNGKFSKPKNIDALAHSQDILPTLIDLCKLEYKKLELDGISLKDLIMGKTKETPDRFLVMQNAQSPMAKKYHATVLSNKWRLVENKELYNIELDPGQKVDVASSNPELVKKMQNHYENWWSSVQEPLNNIPSFPVGGDNCSNITLTCFDWHGFEGKGNVTIQSTVREGGSANGHWNIEVLEAGKYEISCSRWPAEAKNPLTSGLPELKTLTITFPKGIALPIAYTEIQIGDTKKTVKVSDTDLVSSDTFNLEKGHYKLKGTFFNEKKEPICGAYYIYVNKLN
ncbi:arylsulfatase [Sabulilitoribacter arenilitoris]|uniref:Arylsulfatase n=1 Tax=Wocania arenilitoris TaxID=2044858 RepID=A0AAE3JKG7_9FLAO|nr:arylsulfatase [Wocania arenilitoris]MCF7567037.1 arylsulfatase [Wocania arenilitoris]